MKKIILLVICLLLVGCAKPTPLVVTNTEIVTQLATQLITIEVTRQVEVTREIIVTATYSGPTATPEPTSTPKPTEDLTKFDKGDGSYMVGSEIAPGIWRSSGGSTSEQCALTIKTFSGDLDNITYELPGASIRIPEGQYIVYIGGGSGNKCTWSFLMP